MGILAKQIILEMIKKIMVSGWKVICKEELVQKQCDTRKQKTIRITVDYGNEF